jgi:hypothetical protein
VTFRITETANIETDLEAIIKGLEVRLTFRRRNVLTWFVQKRHPTVPYLVPKDWEQAYNGLLDAMVLVDQLESAFGLSVLVKFTRGRYFIIV